jgi:hypothetical protein
MGSPKKDPSPSPTPKRLDKTLVELAALAELAELAEQRPTKKQTFELSQKANQYIVDPEKTGGLCVTSTSEYVERDRERESKTRYLRRFPSSSFARSFVRLFVL